MRELQRWYAKKKKKADPALTEATRANTELARHSQEWNEAQYEKFTVPLIQQMMRESEVNIGRQGQIFDIDIDRARKEAADYETYARPAQAAYYEKIKRFSEPEYEQQAAREALGDVRTAAAGQAAQLARRNQGLGINPASPQAAQAASDMAVVNTATEAGAATRAREGARDLGLKLTSDAANFGRGGLSGIVGLGSGASGASSAGLGGATAGAGTVAGSTSGVNTGLGIAGRAYGTNVESATDIYKTKLSQPSALAQIGGLVGQVGAGWASGGFKTSDRRLKKQAKRIAILAHDIGLWAFRYLWDADTAPLRYGIMADEVEPVFPEAVATGPGGYKLVDYSKVPV